MKALRTKIGTYAVVLLMSCGFTVPLMAGSSDFAGIYGALTGSAGGAQVNGRHVSQDGEISEGKVGAVFPVAGYEVGFNLPLGDLFFLGAGHSWSKSGNASIARGDGDSKGGSGLTGAEAGADSSFHLKAKKPQRGLYNAKYINL